MNKIDCTVSIMQVLEKSIIEKTAATYFIGRSGDNTRSIINPAILLAIPKTDSSCRGFRFSVTLNPLHAAFDTGSRLQSLLRLIRRARAMTAPVRRLYQLILIVCHSENDIPHPQLLL